MTTNTTIPFRQLQNEIDNAAARLFSYVDGEIGYVDGIEGIAHQVAADIYGAVETYAQTLDAEYDSDDLFAWIESNLGTNTHPRVEIDAQDVVDYLQSA